MSRQLSQRSQKTLPKGINEVKKNIQTLFLNGSGLTEKATPKENAILSNSIPKIRFSQINPEAMQESADKDKNNEPQIYIA